MVGAKQCAAGTARSSGLVLIELIALQQPWEVSGSAAGKTIPTVYAWTTSGAALAGASLSPAFLTPCTDSPCRLGVAARVLAGTRLQCWQHALPLTPFVLSPRSQSHVFLPVPDVPRTGGSSLSMCHCQDLPGSTTALGEPCCGKRTPRELP